MTIWSSTIIFLQKIGKAFQLPIASLPVAGLMLRFGQPDLLNLPAVAAAGDAIFANLSLIFAVGVAIGFSEKNKTSAAFGGLIAYLIFKEGLGTFTVMMEGNVDGVLVQVAKSVDMAVLGGILIGLVAGYTSDRVVHWKLPDFLGFFSGSRLVPIMAGVFALVLALIFGYVWPPVQIAFDNLGNWIVNAGWIGAFVFGFLNRMLIITGLHQVLNTMMWFVFGSYTNSEGVVFYGDINRFIAGDPTGGAFTAGFYPIMAFGLPAAALAMVICAKPEKRKLISALMLSAAFTSFITGITEPIEFSFMLVAPLLYVIHAILTGLSLVIVQLLDIHLGFTFSASLIDYVLMFGMPAQKNALLLIPIGLSFGVVYFVLFIFMIKTFNLKTPGREDTTDDQVSNALEGSASYDAVIQALGGVENIENVDFCITRLRLVLKDLSLVKESQLKEQGSKGVISPGGNAYQVIFGAKAEKIAEYIVPKLNR